MSGADLQVSTGPLVVDPDVLDAAAARLAEQAARLAGHGAAVLAVQADPALLLSAALAPASAARVHEALADVVLGSRGPTHAGAAALTLATLLRLAALRYRVGDEAADALARAVRRAAARAVVDHPEVVVGAAAAVVAADTAYRGAEATATVVAAAAAQARSGPLDARQLDALEELAQREYAAVPGRVADDGRAAALALAGHPLLVREVVAATPALLDAAATRDPLLAAALAATAPAVLDDTAPTGEAVAGVAAAALALGALTPVFRETGVRVVPARGARAVPTRAPAGIADVLDGVAHQSTGWAPGGAARAGLASDRMPAAGPPPPGSLRLERVTAADGSVAWVVEVPGTQTWTPLPADGATPMDLTTNLRAVAGQPTATADAVVQAMRLAGVGAGEPVLLAGHSQGGLTAAALAADPAVRAEFRVTHVVTAGSPTDGIPVPAGVRTLSLEHTGDLVPVLDGTDAAGGGERTVVRRDTGEAGVAAHGWDGYVETAAAVDASDDPALTAYRDSARAFLDAPGSAVAVFDYTAERSAGAGRER